MSVKGKKGLWKNRDFMKLWAGEAISVVGSQVTLVALPLTAVLILHADAGQMGILGAVQFAPYLLFGLIAGAWVDRVRCRPLMIFGDLGRAFLLALIPLLAVLGMLTMTRLYIVSFLVGVLSLFFDVAYQSYLPSLLKKEELIEGNGKLEAASSLSSVVGPSLAGFLVQICTAPLAIVIDAVSYVWSAFFISRIRHVEEGAQREQKGAKQSIWQDIAEGLRFVLGSRLLRAIAACTGTSNLFGRILFTVFLLYLTNELDVSPGMYGIITAVASFGAFVGALLGGPLAQRFGIGKTIAGSILIGNAFLLLIPFCTFTKALTIPLLLLSQFLWGMSIPIYNMNQVSLRQAYTPSHLLGRMNASMRTIVWGTVPIGSLIGGALGNLFGLWNTLVVGAVGGVFAVMWILFSPIMKVRDTNSLQQDECQRC